MKAIRVSRVKSYLVLVFTLFFISCTLAQKESSTAFYKHFSGRLDTATRITLDLFFQDGKISGFYYYYFPEPGNNKIFYYGKTIPVYGFLDGDKFTLNEFTDGSSSFNGTMDKKNKVTGNWQRKPDEKSIPFSFSEDYSNGSLPFSCYTLSYRKYLKKIKDADKKSPKAEIKLVLLYPDLPTGNQLKDSLDFLITKYLHVDTVPFKNPELLLENIAFDYFVSYHNAYDGVENTEAVASFNWEKNITMDICFNERNIVSLKIDKYVYTGGAHGIMITQYIVCDLTQYRHLLLKDIMVENYEAKLNALLNNKLRKINGIRPDENLKSAGFFEERILTSDNFYINKDGIGFYYNLYHIAPYSAGTTELFLTFAELRELLDPNPSFFWNRSGDEISGNK